MKKLLLSALAVCAFTFSNAQETETTETSFGFAKGDIIVEGNVGFDSSNDKNSETKTNGFDFNPKAGYFMTDDLAVGIQLMVGSSKTEVDGDETSKSSTIGAGVFARYYFLELGKRFKTNVEFGVGFDSEKWGVDDTVTYTDINVGLGLGLNYFVKDNIAITYGLSNLVGFTSSKSDVDGDKGSNGFNVNINEMNNFFGGAQFGLLFKF